MGKIHGKLFGTPVITLDGQGITFPYNKAKALFYYLLVKSQASRDELAGLLWAEEEENIAKKNLRNAIYKIKKSFDEDVLISPKKSIVMLNPNLEIETDIEKFLDDKIDGLEVYSGEFLHGFFVKNAEEFEDWMIKTRDKLREAYVSKLYTAIDLNMENKDYGNVEKYAKSLISADEFDEKAYRVLMSLYKEEGNCNKAIDLYNKLSELLDSELGIAPDIKTKEIFNGILDLMNSKKVQYLKDSKEFFYGRCNELRILENNYKNFVSKDEEKNSKSILITGEAGIGKTKLKEKFIDKIDKENVYLFETNCYQFEKEYLLKPWNSIVSGLSQTIENDNINIPEIWQKIISNIFPTFNNKDESSNVKLLENIDTMKYEVIGEAVSDVLKKISQNKKTILIFEDIQWMDTMSLSLLSSVILHQENSNIIFLATCRNVYDNDIDKFITVINKYNKVLKIELNRFDNNDVENFIRKALPEHRISKEVTEKIFGETEGNTFFLTEYLNIIKSDGDINIMSSKMQDVLKGRFVNISEEGRKILNISALFFDEVPISILKELTGKDELEIMDIIEELENKFILKEINSNDSISFKFTHQKLREYVYIKQSSARKKILHNKIGAILQSTLKNNKSDIDTYYKLIYHFSNAGNDINALKYSIKSLNVYLNFSHELFPILYSSEYSSQKYVYFDKKQTVKKLKEIESLLKEVKKKENVSEELIKLEIAFLHMKGRYLIREGDYEQGLINIEEMIEKSLEIKDRDYALEGYKQMIYYCIQTNNADMMIKYVGLALNLAVECNYHKEIGILLRLKGRYKIMCGEYEEAEKLLNESINIFNVTKKVADKYSLNIAAAYNYIGEIRRYNMKFANALNYYDKAIEICKDKNVLTSLSIFSINAGQAAFEMGDYYRAKGYFERALDVYKQFDSMWGRSIAEAFNALLKVKEGNYNTALQCLKNADIHSGQLKNPHELGLVYRIKAEIKVNMRNNEALEKVFSKYLDKSVEEYCEKGKTYLKEARDSYEIDTLEILRKS